MQKRQPCKDPDLVEGKGWQPAADLLAGEAAQHLQQLTQQLLLQQQQQQQQYSYINFLSGSLVLSDHATCLIWTEQEGPKGQQVEG
jgi:hypothetical protein